SVTSATIRTVRRTPSPGSPPRTAAWWGSCRTPSTPPRRSPAPATPGWACSSRCWTGCSPGPDPAGGTPWRSLAQGHGGLVRIHREGERFGEVELDVLGVVREVPDRQVLADVQGEVAAARGQHHRPVHPGRPHDLAVDEALEVLLDRIAVVGGLRDRGERLGVQQDRVGAVHA